MSNTQIVRLYTREAEGPVADVTLDPGKDAQVIMEVEAGEADWRTGARFEAGLSIVELDGVTPFTDPETTADPSDHYAPYHGSMTESPWTSQDQSFIYTIRKDQLAAHDGHTCKAYGHLLVGAVDRETYLVESPPFLVHA